MTVVATGRLVHEALKAAEEAEKDGISVEVVDPRTLLPLDEETIVGSVRKTTRCVTAHEAVTRGGFGAELAAVIQHGAFDWLDAPIERVGAKFAPLAFAPGDGAVGRPARRRRPRRDPPDGGPGVAMATEVKLPRLGQGMESGTIVRWLKTEGEAVAKGEPLYELDTDKVTQEVEAESDGVLLKIVVADGEVDVGTTVGDHRRAGRGRRRAARRRAGRERRRARGGSRRPRRSRTPSRRQPPSDTVSQGEVARRAALGSVSESRSRAPRRAREGEPARAADRARARRRPRADHRHGTRGPRHRRGRREGARRGRRPRAPRRCRRHREVEVVELTSTRKTIARRLTEAWEAPVFQLTVTADATELVATRERMVELLREGETKPTVSDVLTRLVASALVRHRPVNANFVDGKIHRFAAANVGLAVAAPSGLVVPVIRDADRKSVQQIAADRADIVSRARDGKLQLADLEGGTFTISNLGMYGIEQFVAVLNPPQVAILAVGSIEDRADRDRRRARDRADDDDDAHVRPPRDRRLGGRRVPARRQGVRRSAGAARVLKRRR